MKRPFCTGKASQFESSSERLNGVTPKFQLELLSILGLEGGRYPSNLAVFAVTRQYKVTTKTTRSRMTLSGFARNTTLNGTQKCAEVFSQVLLSPVFNSDSHSYATPTGQALVSVTQSLVLCGIIDTRWFDEVSAWRGTCVHECCRLWDLGILKESSVDPGAMGYLDSWREWVTRTGFKPKRVEQPTYHPTAMYAGTPDVDNDEMDVDRKTGACAPWHAIQLALYSNFHPNARARRRIVVRLQPNGKPITVDHTADYSRNLAVGLSAVNVARWKRGL